MTHNLTLIKQALKQQLATTDKNQIGVLKRINNNNSKLLLYNRHSRKFELYKNTEFLCDFSDLQAAVWGYQNTRI